MDQRLTGDDGVKFEVDTVLGRVLECAKNQQRNECTWPDPSDFEDKITFRGVRRDEL